MSSRLAEGDRARDPRSNPAPRPSPGRRRVHPILALALVLALAPACSLSLGLPTSEPEESLRACSNGIDDDLDGEVDCADPSCRAFCWDGSALRGPMMTPCFTDDAHALAFSAFGSPTRCEPASEVACPAGAHLLPGAEACRRVGDACPDGDAWPSIGDARVTWYVRPGATGGDGSEDAPWGSLREALDAASAGDRVLLGAGTFDAAVVDRAVELRGVCAGGTIVRGTLHVEAPGVELAELTVEAESVAVVAGAEMHGVAIEARGGLRVEDGVRASLVGSRLERGDAVVVDVGAEARLELVASSVRGGDVGIRSAGGALALRGVAVRGTRERGIVAEGAVSMDGALLEPTGGAAADVRCDASDACALDYVVVRAAPGLVEGTRGLVVRGAATVTHSVFTGAEIGVEVEGSLRLEDSIVEQADRAGIAVSPGAALVVTRTLFFDNRFRALSVGVGASATLLDVEARGIARIGTTEACVEVFEGASLGATSFLFGACGLCGMRLVGPEIELILRDGMVAQNARGVCLVEGASPTVAELTSRVTYLENGAGNIVRE
ncbi:MAG: hypothetical protein KF901_11265 [Myxococcales bacterium]|nr:hypothetical protein [Myxococcales bacterium]